MYREHVKWWSPSLNREMEFLWFGKFGRPVVLFPTSAGRYFENEDFHLVDSVADKVESGEIQVILPDTVNNESWYNKGVHPAVRAARHTQYDAYLRHELVPYIHNRAQRGDLVVYGASFGAYHASNFAARYPDVVSKAICFSGVFDIASFSVNGRPADDGKTVALWAANENGGLAMEATATLATRPNSNGGHAC